MRTIEISITQYEELKRLAAKMRLIDQTIHEELTTKDLMCLQNKGRAFEFLRKEPDLYSEDDVINE